METPKRSASSDAEDLANNLAGESVGTPVYHTADRRDPIRNMKDTLGRMDTLLRDAQQALRVHAAQYVRTTPSAHAPPAISNEDQQRIQELQSQLHAAEQRAREAEAKAEAAEARAVQEQRRADDEASTAAAAKQEAKRLIQEQHTLELQRHASAENEASDARRAVAKLAARVLAKKEAAKRAEQHSRLLEEKLALERSRVDTLGRPQAVAFGACQVALADGTTRPANVVVMRSGEHALELTERTGKQWYLLLPEEGSGSLGKVRCMALNAGSRAGDMAQLDRCWRSGSDTVHMSATDTGTGCTFKVCWQHHRKVQECTGRVKLQDKAAGTVVG